MAELFFISLSDGSIDYTIVKDYCQEEGLETLEMYQRMRTILARVKAE